MTGLEFDNARRLSFVLLIIASLGINVFLVTPPNVTLFLAAVFKLDSWALFMAVVTFSPVFFKKIICNKICVQIKNEGKKQQNSTYHMHTCLAALNTTYLRRIFIPLCCASILFAYPPVSESMSCRMTDCLSSTSTLNYILLLSSICTPCVFCLYLKCVLWWSLAND